MSRVPIVLLGFCLCLAACAPTGTSVSSVTPLTKTQGNLTVSLTADPAPIKPGVPTHLTLTLRDEQNRPIADAAIKINLEMLGMKMDKNAPEVTPVGNGVYTATATFPMGGNTWAVELDISRGGVTTPVSFPNLQVKD